MRVSAASRLRSWWSRGGTEHACRQSYWSHDNRRCVTGHKRTQFQMQQSMGCCTCGSRPGRSSLSDVVQFWQRLLSGACSARSQVRAARDLNAARRQSVLELWRKVASLENLEGAQMTRLGCCHLPRCCHALHNQDSEQ